MCCVMFVQTGSGVTRLRLKVSSEHLITSRSGASALGASCWEGGRNYRLPATSLGAI